MKRTTDLRCWDVITLAFSRGKYVIKIHSVYWTWKLLSLSSLFQLSELTLKVRRSLKAFVLLAEKIINTCNHCQAQEEVAWWSPWHSLSLSGSDTWAAPVGGPEYHGDYQCSLVVIFKEEYCSYCSNTHQTLIVLIKHEVISPLHRSHKWQIRLEWILIQGYW